MSNVIKPGYMGVATINGAHIRCTSFSIQPQNTVLFYNHVIGLNDTIPSDESTKGETVGIKNIQRTIWRPSPIAISGGMAFPATDLGFGNLLNLAQTASYFDIQFKYYCGHSKTFKNCRVNNFEFSVQQGDILNVSMDVVGMNIEDGGFTNNYQIAEKLVTWDKVTIHVGTSGFPFDDTLISGFNFKINNNISNIYTNGTTANPSLFPYDLRAGMQEVSGSISIYLDGGREFIPISLSSPATISMVYPGGSMNPDVVFESSKIEGAIGPVMTQLPFVGVDIIK